MPTLLCKELCLIHSYLQDGYQIVVVNNTKSVLQSVNTGVPQGFEDGAHFFLLYLETILVLTYLA